ncbi:MAG: divalent-cation tolerance protein CutA [Terrimicrobiaceae bacterium]|jgi:periplasmic divalent cation tolerance protein
MTQVVLTTFADEDTAVTAVRILVNEQLAACGTIVPGARSIYAWQGRIEESAEFVVLFKTSRAGELAARLSAIHPYETPEILTFEADSFSDNYDRWVNASCCANNPGSASR